MNNALTVIFVALHGVAALKCILQLIYMLWYWKASKKGHWYVEVLSEQGLDEYDLKGSTLWLGYEVYCLLRILGVIITFPIFIPIIIIEEIIDRVKETRESEQE